MKKSKYLIALVLILFSFGCGHYLENNGSYTFPSLKEEPVLYYPMAALQNSYSGTPRVVLYISKDGNVEKVQLAKSSGIGILDSAALDYSKNLISIAILELTG